MQESKRVRTIGALNWIRNFSLCGLLGDMWNYRKVLAF